jgi:MFS family permease
MVVLILPLSTIFYVGQFCSEWPFLFLLHRFSVVRFTAVTIVLWGIVLATAAATQNFGGFAAQRFVLGAMEGAVSPAFVLITSFWYKKREHAIRTAIWVSCNLWAQILGALIMYGLGTTNTAIASWRLLFLTFGAATALVGIAFFFLFPTSPATARFLNEAERKVAVDRLAAEKTTADHSKFEMQQIKETLLDPKYWCIFAMSLGACCPSFVISFQV